MTKQHALGIHLADQHSPDWVDISNHHEVLWLFLQKENGTSYFDDALIFFPSIKSTTPWLTIEDLLVIMQEHGFLEGQQLIPFATDVFGFLFLLGHDGIYHMQTEDGRLDKIADDLNDFLLKLLEESHYYSGDHLMKAWQQDNGPLKAGYRLTAKRPFMFGGNFEAANLIAHPYKDIFTWYCDLHHQLKDVEDGTNIQFYHPFLDTDKGEI